MLALTRKQGERIIITVPPSTETRVIDLMVMSFTKTSAKVSFQADKDIIIRRLEIQQRVDAEEAQ